MIPPRPHPFTRSNFAKRANRLIATMWERGWTEKPSLEPDHLWSVASEGYSREDEVSLRSEEDAADFRLRLEKLCASLETARLNALGHTMAYGQLKSAIRARHTLGRLWRSKPEMATTAIAPPIIVLGQMRSGTTRVQRLLAADPQFSGTRFCDSHNPVPASPDLRPLKARAALFMARRVNPWLDTLHPFGATRTDEEIGWLAAALSPAAFEAQWRIPAYLEFSERRDASAVYREFSRILRTDAAFHGNAERRRVLKCPQFAEDLPALLHEFPDALIVHCQRDPTDVLASSVSMVASQMALQSDVKDVAALESEWKRKISLREERMAKSLSNFSGKYAAADFDALNATPHDMLAEIYDLLGLDYERLARANVTKELEQAANAKFRNHKLRMAGIG